jgi:hypothetical protein
MRGLAGGLEEAGDFAGVVFRCHEVGILLPDSFATYSANAAIAALTCFRRLHLIAGSVATGHDFVVRSHWPARFGSAAAGWAAGRGRCKS